MRLHLIIQRHGLPVTRILWTTSPPSSQAAPTPRSASSSSALTSTRAPNATYGNGDYTVAQLLEDVNEVIPLETQGGSTSGARDDYDDEESGIGQWGLEDYVVEVNGFECLHFMEVEGLLRDGDEVVLVTPQLSFVVCAYVTLANYFLAQYPSSSNLRYESEAHIRTTPDLDGWKTLD